MEWGDFMTDLVILALSLTALLCLLLFNRLILMPAWERSDRETAQSLVYMDAAINVIKELERESKKRKKKG